MFELNKEKLGQFIAQLRKEKGMTQKELAQQLFVSDKAVSKWERGLSIPDVSLLMPLAKILDITVTELLECQRIEPEHTLDIHQVDGVVKKTLLLSDQKRLAVERCRKKQMIWFVVCLSIVGIEFVVLYWQKAATMQQWEHIVWLELLFAVFGLYVCFFVKEQLPAYYDQYAIHAYMDGVFRLNLPGIRFHNGNWPYIIQYCRIWLLGSMVIFPPAYLLSNRILEQNSSNIIFSIILLLVLASLFVPLYILGKKYE